MILLGLASLVFLLLLAGAAMAFAIAAGRKRFRALVASDVAKLFSDPGPAIGPDELAARWGSLPEPIQEYLRFAVPQQAPALRTVRLKHNGTIRVKPDQPWMPIQGAQYFTVGRPGFVWNGRARREPFIQVEVRDLLMTGRGNMLVKLFSTFTLADARGAEIDQGSRMRWLAEMMWFPCGFAGELIHWEAIDSHSARATLVQAGSPVCLMLEINDEGQLVRVSGDRYFDSGEGKPRLTPWVGRCADYRDFGGLRVPTSVEVSWNLKDNEFTYVRFHITELEYNVTELWPD